MADECDFCSNPNVVRRYQCMDFNAESEAAGVMYDGTRSTVGPTNLVLHSKSYWAACRECARHVDAEDLDGLLMHVIETLLRDTKGDVRSKLIRHCEHTYKLFFKNRIRVTE